MVQFRWAAEVVVISLIPLSMTATVTPAPLIGVAAFHSGGGVADGRIVSSEEVAGDVGRRIPNVGADHGGIERDVRDVLALGERSGVRRGHHGRATAEYRKRLILLAVLLKDLVLDPSGRLRVIRALDHDSDLGARTPRSAASWGLTFSCPGGPARPTAGSVRANVRARTAIGIANQAQRTCLLLRRS